MDLPVDVIESERGKRLRGGGADGSRAGRVAVRVGRGPSSCTTEESAAAGVRPLFMRGLAERGRWVALPAWIDEVADIGVAERERWSDGSARRAWRRRACSSRVRMRSGGKRVGGGSRSASDGLLAGEGDVGSSRVARLLRNGVGWTRPVTRALLGNRALAALMREAVGVVDARGLMTTEESPCRYGLRRWLGRDMCAAQRQARSCAASP